MEQVFLFVWPYLCRHFREDKEHCANVCSIEGEEAIIKIMVFWDVTVYSLVDIIMFWMNLMLPYSLYSSVFMAASSSKTTQHHIS